MAASYAAMASSRRPSLRSRSARVAVEQVIVVEAELVHELQRAGGAFHLGHRDAPVEGDDGGRRHRHQLVVERQDLAPVRVRGGRGVAVHGVDRGLKLIGPGAAQPQAGPDEILALGDHGPVPPAAVLVGEQDQRAVWPGAGRTAGLGQEQQRQQATDLGLVGHQPGQQPGQADGLGAQVGADEVVAGRGRVSLVEDQIDHGQHERQPVGQLRVARHAVGDAGRADLPLGPDQALGDGRLGHEEGPGDLGGLEPGDEPQRQRKLGLGGEGRMAAGEDQPQAVIVHRSHLGHLGVGVQQGRLCLAARAGRLAPQAVQGLVAGRGDDPAARVGRHARGGPALRGHGEGLLDRVLGDVDVAEDAGQGGHGAPRALPVGALDGGRIRARQSPTPRRSPGTAGPPPARRTPRTPWPPRRARRPGRGPR